MFSTRGAAKHPITDKPPKTGILARHYPSPGNVLIGNLLPSFLFPKIQRFDYNAAVRLSIDLSNRAGSLALHSADGRLLSAISMEGENRHSELLLDTLTLFLKDQNLALSDIKSLVTSQGPGSFTGLRIAVSTLKGFSMALQIPVSLVNGSEARGRAYRKRHPEEKRSLVLVTRVASSSYSLAELSPSGEFTEDWISGLPLPVLSGLALADSEETSRLISKSVVFPIQAEYLGEQLESCVFKTEAKSFEDLIKASPHYYGSSVG